MSLSIDQKKAVVTEVTQALSAAQAAVLAEYRGLTVAQITELRTEARNLGVTCVSSRTRSPAAA